MPDRVPGRHGPQPTHWLPSTQGFVGATLDVTLRWQLSRLVSGPFPDLTQAVLDAAKAALA